MLSNTCETAAAPGPVFDLALRLGDNALILGQRLGEWTGHGPVLEEDIALTNVALDLLGQARLWLTLAGNREGQGRSEDDLAYFRDESAFRNALLVEQPNGDYAVTTMRQFFFDAWHLALLTALAGSTDQDVAAIAAKARMEAAYHLRRSAAWVVRLGDGTAASRARMVAALDRLWPYTGELFEEDETDRGLAAAGIAPLPGSLRTGWLGEVARVFAEATLDVPAPCWMHSGGRRGVHSEHMGFVLAEMQSLARAHPGATW